MTKMQKQGAGFAALLIVSVVLGWNPLCRTLALSWRNDEYTYILLLLPFSIAVSLAGQSSSRFEWKWDPAAGVPVCVTAAALWAAGHLASAHLTSDLRLSTDMLALVLSWLGCFVLCFGREAARSKLFSLLLLFGMVPLPDFAMERIVAWLQKGSAWSAHALFVAFGVPVIRHGVLLSIPNLTIQVAEECSSIRSSSMLLVTAMISAKVLVRSPWRRLMIILLAVPLSVAKNGLRIFVIAMLGTRVDPGYLTGKLHRQGGILFFIIALAGIFAAITIARKREACISPNLRP